jgi:hypothetical protein
MVQKILFAYGAIMKKIDKAEIENLNHIFVNNFPQTPTYSQ